MTVIRRSEWTSTEVKFSVRMRAQGAVIHHSATPNRDILKGDDEKQAALKVLHGIYLHHTGSNGWADIGYHFFISRGGMIVEARSSSALVLVDGLMVPGAHCPTKNHTHVGICLEGNYMTQDMPSIMWESLVRLLAKVSIAAGFPLDRQRVLLHREVRSTACPGDIVASKIDAILEHANRVRQRETGGK